MYLVVVVVVVVRLVLSVTMSHPNPSKETSIYIQSIKESETKGRYNWTLWKISPQNSEQVESEIIFDVNFEKARPQTAKIIPNVNFDTAA